MSSTLRIGINGSGGDRAMNALRGAYKGAIDNPDVEVWLYLDLNQSHIIDENIMSFPRAPENLKFIETADRNDLRQAIKDLRAGKINAILTPKNSAALTREAYRAKFFNPGGESPALIIPHPTWIPGKFCYLMDAGVTNKISDSIDLQFTFCHWALMGQRFLAKKCESQRIGLINISMERAYADLEHSDAMLRKYIPSYIGFVEPKDLVSGDVDLALCEGFVGNLILKEIEVIGSLMAKMIIDSIEDDKSKAQAAARCKKEFSADAYLISPFLTTSGYWIFRTHGASTADQIAAAVGAVCRYPIEEKIW